MSEKKVKLIHTADIHLDTPFSSLNARQSIQRGEELRSAFAALMTYIRVNGIDIVLIAGDLFDCAYATRDTVHLLQREFSANPNTRFVIAPGNHDPYTQDSIYSTAAFPDNVYIFDSSEVSCFSFDDIGADVYGYAFTGRNLKPNPLIGYRPKDNGNIKLLCAHCNLGKDNDYAPITEEELLDCGFDYAALGHIHNTEGIMCHDSHYYGYCGCLEGRDFGECGYKGAIYALLRRDDRIFDAAVNGIRFSRRRYEKAECVLSGCADTSSAYNRISEVINRFGNDTSLRLTLSGTIQHDIMLSESYISSQLAAGLFSFELQDGTSPSADYSRLEKDPTLRGEFYRTLKDKLISDDADIRSTAELALKMGLAALSGKDPAYVQFS